MILTPESHCSDERSSTLRISLKPSHSLLFPGVLALFRTCSMGFLLGMPRR